MVGFAAIISTSSPTQPKVVSTIKIKSWVFTSSYKEEIAAMGAALQYISTNVNSVCLRSVSSSSAQIANHYVRHSHHATPEPLPFVNAYNPFHHPSSYNGFQDTPTSLAMSLQRGQWRKQPQLNQTRSTPDQFHAPFRSPMICSVIILLLTPAQTISTNIARFGPTTNTKPQRWYIDHSTPFRTPPITKDSSSLSDWPRNWSYVFIM